MSDTKEKRRAPRTHSPKETLKSFLCKYEILHVLWRKVSAFGSSRCALQSPDLEPYVHSVDPMLPDSVFLLTLSSAPVLYTWMFPVKQEGASDSIRGLRRQ